MRGKAAEEAEAPCNLAGEKCRLLTYVQPPAQIRWIRRPCVFIVDDERMLADTLAEIFASAGFDSFPFYSAGSALQVALEMTPDLLISDVMLDPDTINGVELAIYFERLYPCCRVVLISGATETPQLLNRVRTARQNFPLVTKPVPPGRLIEIAISLLEHLQHREQRLAS